MEQEIEIDVMIADASHEVYVDTILDTIMRISHQQIQDFQQEED